MARKIIVKRPESESPALVETAAEEDAVLQTLFKENPDLPPSEEFGFRLCGALAAI